MSLLLYLQLFCGFEATKRENAKNVFPLQLFDFLNIAFHPLRARSLHIIGDMAVYIQCESSCMMPKVALHGLDVIACPKRGDGIAVPIGYNRDKHKISRGSWGFSDLSLFFFRKKPRNRGFPRGAKVVTSCKGQNLFAAQEETDMKQKERIIALCNQKGGVGKSTTVVNLGIGLARQGKRVLALDIDAQGSLTASLGFQNPDQLEDTLATALYHVMNEEPLPQGYGILHYDEGIDFLPANIELSGLEVTLVTMMSWETVLRRYLQTVQDNYDVILLACCPSLGMLTINALAAADEIVVPVMAHYLSLKALEQLLRTVTKVKRQINPNLKISGILITMADMRTNYTKDIIELLRFRRLVPVKQYHKGEWRTGAGGSAYRTVFFQEPSFSGPRRRSNAGNRQQHRAVRRTGSGYRAPSRGGRI